jgi:hypothetical protein
MDWTCILFGVLFIAAGVLFAWGKLHHRFSAWKNMPEREKEKIRIRPLCRNIGGMIALSGILFCVKGVWSGFKNHWFVLAMVLWLILAGFDVWYISKSGGYYKE